MNELLFVTVPLIAGMILGIIFFGGLWITVRRALKSNMPVLWFGGGFISRMTITLLGFYFVAQNSWQKFLVCLLGFIVARFIVLRYTKKIEEKENQLKEATNAA